MTMAAAGKQGDLEFGTLAGLIETAARRYGDAPAVEDGDVTLSFVELRERARVGARALAALGVEVGDRVAIWAPNGWRWIVAALAIQEAGAVLVPINTRFKGEEASHVLVRSGARVLFTARGFLGVDYVEMLRPTPAGAALSHVVVMHGEAGEGALSWEGFTARASEAPASLPDERAKQVTPSSLCDLLFTSGTTGKPKGVRCTHAQTLRAFRDWADVVGLRAGDRYLVVLPLFHSFGYKAGLLASLMMGATVLPEAVFDVDVVLRRVARDRVTVLPGPPSLYQSILARADLASHDLSSLRLAVTGAAVIPVELVERMRRELRFQTVITGYGLTEATGVTTMCREGDDPETIATTSGRAIPGIDVRVVDDAGVEVPRGEPGEIVVRGYTVTQGYFEDPGEATAVVDAEGYLHTGDIGVMDSRGYLRITDRKKDMFIVGGFNAYPAEIEAVIARHPGVSAVAVVGMPDARLGEVGAAFVVPRPGSTPRPEEIVAMCRDAMANYKVPRRVELIDALPMNASGKVQKFRLREITRTWET